MTRRERLERKIEKREEWAAGHRSKAAGLEKRNEPFRGDHAFNTQPGHIPERARVIKREDRAHEHRSTARDHGAKAAGLAAQLDRSIFSDDEDAAEKLEEKAAGIEAECERMKAVNLAFRKAPGDDKAAKLAALLEAGTICRAEAVILAKFFGTCSWETQPYPSYALSNRRANARRLRKRIETIAAQAKQTAKAEEAGGVLVERIQGQTGPESYARITFPEYPGRQTVQALKAAGFHWSRPSWYGPADKIPAQVQA